MPLTQLKIDITEFLLNNKDEVKSFVIEETSHMLVCERIFVNHPEIFDEMLEKARVNKLKNFIQNQFSLNGEQIDLIFDDSFVNIVLQY